MNQKEIDLIIERKMNRSYAVKGAGTSAPAVSGRTVTGFYNTFNFIDSDGDVLLSGCASKSIRENGPKSKSSAKIKHALFHDLTRLPGRIDVLGEESKDGIEGIYFETAMDESADGNETLMKYREKIYDNHSIGFQYKRIEHIEKGASGWDKTVSKLLNPAEAEERGYLFLVKEIRMFEGSTVAYGANRLTPALGIKSRDKASVKLAIDAHIQKMNRYAFSSTDDARETYELQVLQLKQMIEELDQEPEDKPTHVSAPGKANTRKSARINWGYVSANFKI